MLPVAGMEVARSETLGLELTRRLVRTKTDPLGRIDPKALPVSFLPVVRICFLGTQPSTPPI